MRMDGLSPEYSLKTYRYLRIGILSATGLLATSIVVDLIETRCALTSISAYYYSTVRAVFVGSLLAIGLALIVLKGDRFEDLALNVAGILAPMVAVVPTRAFDTFGSCDISDPLRLGDRVLLGTFLDRSVANNMWALIVTGLLGFAVTIFVYAKGRAKRAESLTETLRGPDSEEQRTLIELGLFVLIAGLVAVWFVFFRRSFLAHGHEVAAISMFAALAVAAWVSSNHSAGAYRSLYRAVAVGMVVSFPLIWAVGRSFPWWIFLVEAVEIALFGLYWAVQTREHWYERVDVRNCEADAVVTDDE